MTNAYVRNLTGAPASIRYVPIRFGRSGELLDAPTRLALIRVVCEINKLDPEILQAILALPNWRLGRMFKRALRRALKATRKPRTNVRSATRNVIRVQHAAKAAKKEERRR
jgi:hypothetical protein